MTARSLSLLLVLAMGCSKSSSAPRNDYDNRPRAADPRNAPAAQPVANGPGISPDDFDLAQVQRLVNGNGVTNADTLQDIINDPNRTVGGQPAVINHVDADGDGTVDYVAVDEVQQSAGNRMYRLSALHSSNQGATNTPIATVMYDGNRLSFQYADTVAGYNLPQYQYTSAVLARDIARIAFWSWMLTPRPVLYVHRPYGVIVNTWHPYRAVAYRPVGWHPVYTGPVYGYGGSRTVRREETTVRREVRSRPASTGLQNAGYQQPGMSNQRVAAPTAGVAQQPAGGALDLDARRGRIQDFRERGQEERAKDGVINSFGAPASGGGNRVPVVQRPAPSAAGARTAPSGGSPVYRAPTPAPRAPSVQRPAPSAAGARPRR